MSRLASAAVLAALCACSIPALDTAGNIRCGTEGECPDAYECRIGRCCPASAPRNACPVLPAGIVGSPCAPALGACSINLGDRTASNGLCAAFPGGYCTLRGCDPATSSVTCGAYGVCVNFGGANYCMRACDFGDAPAPCRDGAGETVDGGPSRYLCIKDAFDRDPHAGVCIPDCAQSASVCAAGRVCDAATHTCVTADCRGSAGACEAMGRYCSSTTGRCVKCNDAGAPACGLGMRCVASSGRCQQICSNLLDNCPSGEVCRSNLCERR